LEKWWKIWNNFFLCWEFFFSKNKNYHGNLPQAGRFREFDHQKIELTIALILHRIESSKIMWKKNFNFGSGKQIKKGK
jgi:hypothetical protein